MDKEDKREELFREYQRKLQKIEEDRDECLRKRKKLEEEEETFYDVSTAVNQIFSDSEEYWQGDAETIQRFRVLKEEAHTLQRKVLDNIQNEDEERQHELSKLSRLKEECEREYRTTKEKLEK